MWATVIQAVLAIITALLKNKERVTKLKDLFIKYMNVEEKKTESKDLNEDYKKQLNEMNKDDNK